MPFVYARTIRFADTDAAGVVYFANVLSICHEAYEAALAAAGADLKLFFGGSDTAIPIAHASIDFLRPLFCGDRCCIQVTPEPLTDHSFAVHYALFREGAADRLLAKAQTQHVAITISDRQRAPLPPLVRRWLQA